MSEQPPAKRNASPVNETELKQVAALLAGNQLSVATNEPDKTGTNQSTCAAIETDSPTTSVKALRARWEEKAASASATSSPNMPKRPEVVVSLEEFHLLQRSRMVAEQLQKEQVLNFIHKSGRLEPASPLQQRKPSLEPATTTAASVSSSPAVDASTATDVLVDYKSKDYRGFIFVVHPEWGLLLLHCTRKKQKVPHYQLPGGHVDEEEFQAAGMWTD